MLRNPVYNEYKTISDWSICPIYEEHESLKQEELKYQIIGIYDDTRFRSSDINGIHFVGVEYMMVSDDNNSLYKLYYEDKYIRTFCYKNLYEYEYQYIERDGNDRFRLIGYLDKDCTKSWRTTPITYMEYGNNGKAYAYTESGSIYILR